jgi:hypothetical protein
MALLEDVFWLAKFLNERTRCDVADAWREAQTQPITQTFARRNHGFSLVDKWVLGCRFWLPFGSWARLLQIGENRGIAEYKTPWHF